MRWIVFFLMCGLALPARAADVTVFAAASLKTVLEDIAGAWPAGTVAVSLGGSGAVARQVALGAPADIVILANDAWMDWLMSQGAIEGAPVVLASNALVFVSADPAPLNLTPDALQNRLGAGGRLAMGDLRAVPAGIYGAEALRGLGLFDAVAVQIAPTDNVRSALAFVARAEAPLGIVYATDAVAEPRVYVVAEIPAQTHGPIVYPAAQTDLSHAKAAAFMSFLQTQAAQDVFAQHGFLKAPIEKANP